ncbi:MAG: hypothetical protein U0790_18660 [Isosphaeraceae bacterium]
MDSITLHERLSGLTAILPDPRTRVDLPPPRREATGESRKLVVDLRRLLWRGRRGAFDLACCGIDHPLRPVR